MRSALYDGSFLAWREGLREDAVNVLLAHPYSPTSSWVIVPRFVVEDVGLAPWIPGPFSEHPLGTATHLLEVWGNNSIHQTKPRNLLLAEGLAANGNVSHASRKHDVALALQRPYPDCLAQA